MTVFSCVGVWGQWKQRGCGPPRVDARDPHPLCPLHPSGLVHQRAHRSSFGALRLLVLWVTVEKRCQFDSPNTSTVTFVTWKRCFYDHVPVTNKWISKPSPKTATLKFKPLYSVTVRAPKWPNTARHTQCISASISFSRGRRHQLRRLRSDSLPLQEQEAENAEGRHQSEVQDHLQRRCFAPWRGAAGRLYFTGAPEGTASAQHQFRQACRNAAQQQCHICDALEVPMTDFFVADRSSISHNNDNSGCTDTRMSYE